MTSTPTRKPAAPKTAGLLPDAFAPLWAKYGKALTAAKADAEKAAAATAALLTP